MWFKKKPQPTHIYNWKPVIKTGRYYLVKTYIEQPVITRMLEILDRGTYSWVPENSLYEIQNEL